MASPLSILLPHLDRDEARGLADMPEVRSVGDATVEADEEEGKMKCKYCKTKLLLDSLTQHSKSAAWTVILTCRCRKWTFTAYRPYAQVTLIEDEEEVKCRRSR